MGDYTPKDLVNASRYAQEREKLYLMKYSKRKNLVSWLNVTVKPEDGTNYFVSADFAKYAINVDIQVTETVCNMCNCNPVKFQRLEYCDPTESPSSYWVGDKQNYNVSCQASCFNLRDEDIVIGDDGNYKSQSIGMVWLDNKCQLTNQAMQTYAEIPSRRSDVLYTAMVNNFSTGFEKHWDPVLVNTYRVNSRYCYEFGYQYDDSKEECYTGIGGKVLSFILSDEFYRLIRKTVYDIEQGQVVGNGKLSNVRTDTPPIPDSYTYLSNWLVNTNPDYVEIGPDYVFPTTTTTPAYWTNSKLKNKQLLLQSTKNSEKISLTKFSDEKKQTVIGSGVNHVRKEDLSKIVSNTKKWYNGSKYSLTSIRDIVGEDVVKYIRHKSSDAKLVELAVLRKQEQTGLNDDESVISSAMLGQTFIEEVLKLMGKAGDEVSEWSDKAWKFILSLGQSLIQNIDDVLLQVGTYEGVKLLAKSLAPVIKMLTSQLGSSILALGEVVGDYIYSNTLMKAALVVMSKSISTAVNEIGVSIAELLGDLVSGIFDIVGFLMGISFLVGLALSLLKVGHLEMYESNDMIEFLTKQTFLSQLASLQGRSYMDWDMFVSLTTTKDDMDSANVLALVWVYQYLSSLDVNSSGVRINKGDKFNTSSAINENVKNKTEVDNNLVTPSDLFRNEKLFKKRLGYSDRFHTGLTVTLIGGFLSLLLLLILNGRGVVILTAITLVFLLVFLLFYIISLSNIYYDVGTDIIESSSILTSFFNSIESLTTWIHSVNM